jgi:uncharacterized damage-inducible protein DinB
MQVEYLVRRWNNVRAGLLATIDKFRDEELDFKPFAAAYSVRQLILHIAQEEHGEFGYGIVQTLDEFPPEYHAPDYATLESIKALLQSVHAPSIDYLASLADADLQRVVTTPWGATYRLIEMFDHIIEHEIHHRAELSLMLGMLGREGLNA